MSDFDFKNLGQKAAEFASAAMDAARTLTDTAADKTRDLTQLARLNAENTADRQSIKNLYLELGRLYYEAHKDAPDAFCEQLCVEISLLVEKIAEREARIAALRDKKEDDAPAEEYTAEPADDFESVVEAEESAAEAPIAPEDAE